MPSPVIKPEPTDAQAPERRPLPGSHRQKLPALLVTADDSLWTQIAAAGASWAPQQIDSIDELIATIPSGQRGVVLWDARGNEACAAALSRIQLHSGRLVVVALDTAESAARWAGPVEQRQVIAHVTLPIAAERLVEALGRAREEIDARVALLGDAAAGAPAAPGGKKLPWPVMAIAGILVLAAAAWVFLRHPESNRPEPVKAAVTTERAVEPEVAGTSTDEKVDALIERAQRAMLDRHYLDPADGSALSLYREALVLDPSRGEAAQGLRRLAEVLYARAQSALDERKFDIALQALETARSIDPQDPRLTAFDERIASLRAELGPAQIQAVINAQNFDRAAQLIDEASRARVIGTAKLNQLREELRRRREEVDAERLSTLAGARLQQDRLFEPHSDSAAFYLSEARRLGVVSPALQSLAQEFVKHALPAAHGAIEQRHFGDAERLLTEMRNVGAPAATLSALTRELNAARGQREKSDQPQFLDLARTRLAQGNVAEPENDSALYYVNLLRAADTQGPGTAQISGAVQAQLIERARAALDTADSAKADLALRQARTLGDSTDLDALSERLARAKSPVGGDAAARHGGLQEVSENALTRLKPLQPQYPRAALVREQEGWVEIAYTVAANGKVTDIKVLRSSPPGLFDNAAKDAVARLIYQPTLQDGNAVAVTTKIRVAFRLAAK